jgi:hypothetical protein
MFIKEHLEKKKKKKKAQTEKKNAPPMLKLHEMSLNIIVTICRKKKNCINCPFTFDNKEGKNICIFTLTPSDWSKYFEKNVILL